MVYYGICAGLAHICCIVNLSCEISIALSSTLDHFDYQCVASLSKSQRLIERRAEVPDTLSLIKSIIVYSVCSVVSTAYSLLLPYGQGISS